MTETRCWIDFKGDHALQRKIDTGWFRDEQGLYLPIASFPPLPSKWAYWTIALGEWCSLRGVKWNDASKGIGDDTTSAKVKKHQIEDYIQFVYGGSPSYFDPKEMITWKARANIVNSLTDLRGFVAQYLNPRLWYELMADTW